MPLYEYECKQCDATVEILVRSPSASSSSEPAECPDCGDTKLTRVMSATASPAVKSGGGLPVAGAGEACGAPRCCGGGCQM
ncbi:MAG: FmdB family zinc ribbon protein [Pirellulaceae bacterium]